MWSQMSRSEIIRLEPNHFVPLIPANKILVNDVSPLSDDIKVTKVETCSIPANATFVVIDGDDSDYDHSETVERSFENSLSESSDANQNDELTNDQATASEADKTVTLFSGKLNSSFIETEKAVHLLKNTSGEGLGQIPWGAKENCYFLINNTKNIDKRSRNKRSCFSDDCGVWDTNSGASPKTFHLIGSTGDLTVIYKKNNVFCSLTRAQQKRKYVYECLFT
ncbi:hypothetical protein DPMN_120335 [Dreissena polymorpha]|uniref:Uncharacterized protein n=1 Tax=Dreissena polymorpha TaxID=45954 RepID=A0A9D4JS04_DREPO|nr:hypothetical protein DPMN_120335 [Dreissena polymorpha]